MSPVLSQQKAVAPGQLRSWDLDLAAMARCLGEGPGLVDLLRVELEELLSAFPTFIAALGRSLGDDQCWVEAAEPVLCPRCADLVVFDRGVRCARCEQVVQVPDSPLVGVVGRIPALVTGRPFASSLDRRMARLRQQKDSRLSFFLESCLEVEGQRYLAPRYGLWLAQGFPHGEPPVMVWPEYFEVLDIPPDHVFYALPYYRLCLYAVWREQPVVRVLQNRVVPRLLIDLMVADLCTLGQLDEALQRLDASLYEVYNLVGRPEEAGSLQRIYEELVGS